MDRHTFILFDSVPWYYYYTYMPPNIYHIHTHVHVHRDSDWPIRRPKGNRKFDNKSNIKNYYPNQLSIEHMQVIKKKDKHIFVNPNKNKYDNTNILRGPKPNKTNVIVKPNRNKNKVTIKRRPK
jgi:hypothetical protein